MPLHTSRRLLPPLVVAVLLAGAGPARPAQAAVNPADLALLQKALAPLTGAAAIETESDIEIAATKAGATLNVREHLHIVAKKPNKFRSEVSLLPSGGGAGETYMVVSNGPKVLTSNPAAQQFSLVPFATFAAANDDIPAQGLFTGMVYLGDQSYAHIIALFTRDNTAALIATLKKQGMAVSSRTETVDGAALSVVTLDIAKFGTMRFFVDPQAGALTRMSLNGTFNGLSIALTEKITRRSPSPAITAATFQLSPPAGARKVKYIPLGSF